MVGESALTRRDVLKAGAGVAAATGLAGLGFLSTADAAVEDVDYVVIGSGAGGAPVAANLAEAGYSVLVLEAGPAEGVKRFYDVPALQLRAARDPNIAWDFWVRHYSDQSQEGTLFVPDKGGILYPRAATLGGCTAHHALITFYPEHSDWEHIRQLTGDDGWHPERMWVHWEKVKTWQGIEFAEPASAATDDQIVTINSAAVAEDPLYLPPGNTKVSHDLNDRANVDRSAQGFFQTPQTSRNGVRVGPRERLLGAAQRLPNLKITTDALVEKVVLETGTDGRKRAVAVDYLPARHAYAAWEDHQPLTDGQRQDLRKRVRVRKEIIVAGGAFNSPQLLMLSGIGPASHLGAMGINVALDLPGVGTNLQDRYEVSVVSEYDEPFTVAEGCTFSDAEDPCYDQWEDSLLRPTSTYASNGVLGGIKRRYSRGRPETELFVFGVPVPFAGYVPDFDDKAYNVNNQFSWVVLKGYAQSRAGSVRLRSANPMHTPAINFRSFDDNTSGAHDIEAILEGIEVARRINKRAGIGREILPGPSVTSRADLESYIRRQQWGHHASCTNPIGTASDSNAVLDGQLRVRGTSNLRVVDASAFPRIPGLFLWAPTSILAEKASHDILAVA